MSVNTSKINFVLILDNRPASPCKPGSARTGSVNRAEFFLVIAFTGPARYNGANKHSHCKINVNMMQYKLYKYKRP